MCSKVSKLATNSRCNLAKKDSRITNSQYQYNQEKKNVSTFQSIGTLMWRESSIWIASRSKACLTWPQLAETQLSPLLPYWKISHPMPIKTTRLLKSQLKMLRNEPHSNKLKLHPCQLFQESKQPTKQRHLWLMSNRSGATLIKHQRLLITFQR